MRMRKKYVDDIYYYEYSFDFADPQKGSNLRTALLENQLDLFFL